MPFSSAMELAILAHVFKGAPIADLEGETELFLALHTTSPGVAGSSQSTNEVNYGGYARKAVDRATGFDTPSGRRVRLAANADFPKVTSGTMSATYASIGNSDGTIVMIGLITPAISIVVNKIPRLTMATYFGFDG